MNSSERAEQRRVISLPAFQAAWRNRELLTASSLAVALACAMGVGLLLTAIMTFSVLARQDAVMANQRGVIAPISFDGTSTDVTLRWDEPSLFQGGRVAIEAVHRVGKGPVPPGIRSVPRPGEVLVSPHLLAMLDGPQGALLKPRLPGRIVGTIDPSGLVRPDEALAYVGIRPAKKGEQGPYAVPADQALVNSSFSARPADRVGLVIVLWLCLGCLLVPILVLVGTASRLASTRRETRWASLWLSGCSLSALRAAAAGQAVISAAVGTSLGCMATFAVSRTVIAMKPSAFYLEASDFSWVACGLAVIVLPLLAGATTARAIRWSPERAFVVARGGATPTQAGGHPIVLAAGLLAMGVLTATSDAVFALPRPLPVVLELGAILTTLIGAAQATPWLARMLARQIANRRPGPVSQLTSRRIERSTTGSTRAVASVAVFLIVVIMLQGISSLHHRSEADPAQSLAGNQISVDAMSGAGTILPTLEGVTRVESLGSEAGGKCETRYPCRWRVTTSLDVGAVAERLRSSLGWNALVQTRADAQVTLYPGGLPARLRLLSFVLLAVLLITGAALLVGTVDGINERRRTLAALSAFGVSRAKIRSSLLLEVVAPVLMATVLGTILGVVVLELLSGFVGDPVPIPAWSVVVNGCSALGVTAVVALVSLPFAWRTATPDQLRTL